MAGRASDTAKGDTLFSALIATAVDGIMVIDARGTIRIYNDACFRLFGYTAEETIGQNVKMLMPAPYREEHDGYIDRYKKTGEKHIIGIGREVTGRRKDGSVFPMYLSVGEGLFYGERSFVGIVHDISDLHEREGKIRELQGELLHMTRATSMGQMSSALAHELNQPLTAILSYVKAASRLVESGKLQADILSEILGKTADQTMRAGDIIRRLRAFVEKRDHARAPESLNDMIGEAMALGLTGVRNSGVQVTMRLSNNLPLVNADRVEIQQVLINLMRNAAEAMQTSEVRNLSVSTDSDGADYVAVAITDTGPGLSPEVTQRLFQPFVSTKSEGMGMGLNICRTIIEAHGGRIWADAGENGGAVFRFRLPIYDGGA